MKKINSGQNLNNKQTTWDIKPFLVQFKYNFQSTLLGDLLTKGTFG